MYFVHYISIYIRHLTLSHATQRIKARNDGEPIRSSESDLGTRPIRSSDGAPQKMDRKQGRVTGFLVNKPLVN